MKVSALNKRIDIQASAKVPDTMGGSATTWTSVLPTGTTIGASIWPTVDKEGLASHKIRIRYRSIFKTTWRIVFAGRNFNVVSVVDYRSEHKWLDILAKETI